MKKARRRSERRNLPRADARLSMRVEGGVASGATAQIVTESQNISASGVYCTSAHYLAPLSKVSLTIVLPRLPGGRSAKELIKCDGIVVRCQPGPKKTDKHYELACMFSGLDEKRRAMLEEFVAWRNLQALRAAANAIDGPRRAAKPRAKTRTGTKTRAAAAAAAPRTRSRTAARRTVH